VIQAFARHTLSFPALEFREYYNTINNQTESNTEVISIKSIKNDMLLLRYALFDVIAVVVADA